MGAKVMRRLIAEAVDKVQVGDVRGDTWFDLFDEVPYPMMSEHWACLTRWSIPFGRVFGVSTLSRSFACMLSRGGPLGSWTRELEEIGK